MAEVEQEIQVNFYAHILIWCFHKMKVIHNFWKISSFYSTYSFRLNILIGKTIILIIVDFVHTNAWAFIYFSIIYHTATIFH